MRCCVSQQGKNGVLEFISDGIFWKIFKNDDFANADLHTSHTKVTNVCIYIYIYIGNLWTVCPCFYLCTAFSLIPTDLNKY